MLHIVGDSDKRIFGLAPAERLGRQIRDRSGFILVAHASAVMDDAAIEWLIDNPGTVIASQSGRPLAAAVEPAQVEAAAAVLRGENERLPIVIPNSEQFVRKLRRRVKFCAYSLAEEPVGRIERRLFDKVYKGVTDLVTKWAWPKPAYLVTRAASRVGITPNMVTLTGIVLVFLAAWLFYTGQLAAGLVAAWLMTFFDTVDGKLARVTVTSSRIGDILDHGTDVIHPPVWWYCLAHGIVVTEGAEGASVLTAFWIILGTYLVGRLVETVFKKTFGFNQYIWKPFDSRFRLVISRRNTILLIMTLGLLVGSAEEAFWACAIWSVLSTGIQLVRLAQAFAHSRTARVVSWLT